MYNIIRIEHFTIFNKFMMENVEYLTFTVGAASSDSRTKHNVGSGAEPEYLLLRRLTLHSYTTYLQMREM